MEGGKTRIYKQNLSRLIRLPDFFGITDSSGLISSAILLFSKGTFSPLSMIISLKEFTKNPLSLFNDGIVVLLTWIIPIAITSYYPTLLFLGDYSIIGYSASTSAFFRVRTNSVS